MAQQGNGDRPSQDGDVQRNVMRRLARWVRGKLPVGQEKAVTTGFDEQAWWESRGRAAVADSPRQDNAVSASIADVVQEPESREADRNVTETLAQDAVERRLARLSEVFTPSRPKRADHHFAGRESTLARIVGVIQDQKSHILIYGQRGLGKTSLANVAGARFAEAGYSVVRYACGTDSLFADMARGLLQRLPHDVLESSGIDASAWRTEVREADQAGLTPTRLIELLSTFPNQRLLMIVDDLDNITSSGFHRSLIETLKGVSDQALPVSFLMVGVAENIRVLVGEDPRLERNTVAIQLPFMARGEIEALVRQGMSDSGLGCDESIIAVIATLARGLPFIAQTLCLHAASRAIREGEEAVSNESLSSALERVLDEIDPRIRDLYERTTRDESHRMMVDLLFCLSAARHDQHGRVSLEDIAAVPLGAEERYLDAATVARGVNFLIEEEPVLERNRDIDGDVRYTFRIGLLKPYVLMRQGKWRGLLPGSA